MQELRQRGVSPKKSLGQHFLIDKGIAQKIVRLASLEPEDTVVEIGPGPGNLTRHLLGYAGQVIAIEIEHELCSILKAELKADNLTVIEADALGLDFSELAPEGGKLKVVANLPYSITTPTLFKLLETLGLIHSHSSVVFSPAVISLL